MKEKNNQKQVKEKQNDKGKEIINVKIDSKKEKKRKKRKTMF